jgi:endonuclease I
LTGTELSSALKQLIDGHTRYPYTSSNTDVWDILEVVDEDPNNANNVLTLYAGKSIPKNYRDGGSLNSECANDCWNREHVWSKSHGDFGETMGPGTDIHHMHAEDETVNSTKNNLDFDWGGNIVQDLLFGGARVNTTARYDGDSFEPPDEYKGDVARMIMYMAVRYDGTEGYPDLQLVEAVLTDSNTRNSETGQIYGGITGFGYYGRLSTLLEWNELDPPSAFEIARHEKIVAYQNNRNPFIDYYLFARLIWQ